MDCIVEIVSQILGRKDLPSDRIKFVGDRIMVKIISSKYFIRMFCKWHILDTECGLSGLGCPFGDSWLSYKEWLWQKKKKKTFYR